MEKTQKNTKKPLSAADKEKINQYGATLFEHFIRFTAIANAGGAVATITVLGATAKAGSIANILALPLALFSTGVICALLLTQHFLMATIAQKIEPTPEKYRVFQWIRPWLENYKDFLGYGGPFCFIAGVVSGVIIITFV